MSMRLLSFLFPRRPRATAAGTKSKPGRKEKQVPDLDRKSPIVVVHGAWHGGWCWDLVRPLLEAEGHRVFSPTLTGCGGRAHLRHPVPGLETHIEDVLGVIESHELRNAVLVGHSYGGMVVTAVADRAKDKVSRIVYIDAAVPRDGDDFASRIPDAPADSVERMREAFRGLAPDGEWIPAMPPEVVGVDPANTEMADWLRRRLTPHPVRSWLEPVRFVNGGTEGIAKTYVVCTAPPTALMGYTLHAEEARKGGDWTCREIACGHDTMILKPEETARLILEAAA
ncbi:MAG: alpha/beta hydrolase [Parvibaculum sp.]|nr:alpha/beta hydrolase [Parvibaculum sp.]